MKIKRTKMLIVFAFSLILIACEEDDDIYSDIGEIRLTILSSNNEFSSHGSNDTMWYTGSHLVDFNPSSYSNVDSAKILLVGARCQSSSNLGLDMYLYDLSNNSVIKSSKIRIDKVEPSNLYSGNIWNELPKNATSFGRIEVFSNGYLGISSFVHMYLIIYKKKE